MTLDVRSGVLVTMASGSYGYEDRFLGENKCLYSESYHSLSLLEDSHLPDPDSLCGCRSCASDDIDSHFNPQ